MKQVTASPYKVGQAAAGLDKFQLATGGQNISGARRPAADPDKVEETATDPDKVED